MKFSRSHTDTRAHTHTLFCLTKCKETVFTLIRWHIRDTFATTTKKIPQNCKINGCIKILRLFIFATTKKKVSSFLRGVFSFDMDWIIFWQCRKIQSRTEDNKPMLQSRIVIEQGKNFCHFTRMDMYENYFDAILLRYRVLNHANYSIQTTYCI